MNAQPTNEAVDAVADTAAAWPAAVPDTNVPVVTFRAVEVTETSIVGVVPLSQERAVMPVSEFYAGVTPQRDSIWMATAIVTQPTLVVSVLGSDLPVALFSGLVPEVRTGAVRIMGVARDPGRRAKIAVASTDPDVDAVAALVGRNAAWVRAVSSMLHGERIEIVAWHPDLTVYVANALAPASVLRVAPTRFGLRVDVSEAQMPAAVGDNGMNRQLVSELIGMDVSLRPVG